MDQGISGTSDKSPILGVVKKSSRSSTLYALQQAILDCSSAGIKVVITTLYGDGGKQLAIILPGVMLDAGILKEETSAPPENTA